jgi:hypothetical protein
MDKYGIDPAAGCRIEEETSIHVFVPAPYVQPLQEKVDDYLAEMRAADAEGGIDYSTVVIHVEVAPPR